jgi:chromosome segregation ATPase
MRTGLRKALGVALVVITTAGLIVAIRDVRSGTASVRPLSPLAAVSEYARSDNEVVALERRLKGRRERAVKEVRALVRQLEKQVEDQRVRLREQQTRLAETEVDMDRARVLLRDLEGRTPPAGPKPDPSEKAPATGP